jgi:hypothetical protein
MLARVNRWPIVSLGELFDIARGGSPRPISDYLTDAADGVNWISISDASDSAKYIRPTWVLSALSKYLKFQASQPALLRHLCCGGHESRRLGESLHRPRPVRIYDPTHSFFFRHSLPLFVSFFARREFPFWQPHRLAASETVQDR